MKLSMPLQVQEAASACTDWLHLPAVSINLANLYLAQRQIPAAIQLYTTTLQKHYRNNPTVMLYLARALYDAGRNSEAKRLLLKAIHLQPTQNLLRFNSAVTMQVLLSLYWTVLAAQSCNTTCMLLGTSDHVYSGSLPLSVSVRDCILTCILAEA